MVRGSWVLQFVRHMLEMLTVRGLQLMTTSLHPPASSAKGAPLNAHFRVTIF